MSWAISIANNNLRNIFYENNVSVSNDNSLVMVTRVLGDNYKKKHKTFANLSQNRIEQEEEKKNRRLQSFLRYTQRKNWSWSQKVALTLTDKRIVKQPAKIAILIITLLAFQVFPSYLILLLTAFIAWLTAQLYIYTIHLYTLENCFDSRKPNQLTSFSTSGTSDTA